MLFNTFFSSHIAINGRVFFGSVLYVVFARVNRFIFYDFVGIYKPVFLLAHPFQHWTADEEDATWQLVSTVIFLLLLFSKVLLRISGKSCETG